MSLVNYDDRFDLPPIDYDQSKVPQNIKERADGVREAIFGTQNKEFIAQGIELISLTAREALEAQAYDGNSLADVTLAKDGLPTLDARIKRDVNNLENKKADKAEVTAQLAQKADKSEIGAPTQEQVNAWLDANPEATTTVQDGSVSERKTTFAEKVILSDNLVDPTKITEGYTLNANTGEPMENSLYNITGFINVEPQSTYTLRYTTNIYKFDANQNYIGYEPTITFTTGDATAYVRLRISAGSSVPFQLNKDELKKWDEFQSATKIRDLILNEERIKGVTFPNNELKEGLSVTEKNVNFFYRDSPNLFNKDTVTLSKRLSSSNAITDDVNNTVSDYIEVLPNTTYSVTEGSYTHFYDADKTFISGHGVGIKTFTTPENTAHIRITVRKIKLDVFMLILGSTPPSEADYVPFNVYSFTDNVQVAREEKSKHNGKRFGFLGDSIVEGEPYFFSEIKRRLGLSELIDYGIGGTSYSERGNPTWDDKNLVKRVPNMDNTLDGGFVLCGTNDFANAIPLGNFDDRGETTFYGALHLTFSALINKYPLGNIYVLTMPPRYNQTSKVGGVYVHEFVNAIKEVGAYYSIPVLDILSNSQARPWIQANKEYYYKGADGLHPNELMYELILDSFIPFVNAY